MMYKTRALSALGVLSVLAACSDSTSPTQNWIPTSDSTAIQQARGIEGSFRYAVDNFFLLSGLLTDELTVPNGENAGNKLIDQRALDDASSAASLSQSQYPFLLDLRLRALVGAGSLAKFSPDSQKTLRAQMYAQAGYIEIMLADLFCSGVALSTANLDNGKVTFGNGMPRDSIYQHAIFLFDTAAVLATGNDSILTLARVGKGRALLALGQFSAAAQAVANVSQGSTYRSAVAMSGSGNNLFGEYLPANLEGNVGLPYRSGGDPRTISARASQGSTNIPNKYFLDGTDEYGNIRDYDAPVVVADWIEARLIQAEAALHDNDVGTWLQILNQLRATAPVPAPSTPYHDAVTPLAPLSDPGTQSGRVDMMFAERAAWLYLTGHRQGDLRRLMRQYGRTQAQVYPVGSYALGGTYGDAVNLPIPAHSDGNPNAQSCIDRLP